MNPRTGIRERRAPVGSRSRDHNPRMAGLPVPEEDHQTRDAQADPRRHFKEKI